MKTIGLDFGTHQTKICIEDASNPNQKTYDFFKFNVNGKNSFFFPSVLQINEDDTISYGFTNEINCKKITPGLNNEIINGIQRPILKSIPAPSKIEHPIKPTKYSYPTKPIKFKYPEKPSVGEIFNDWKSKLLTLKGKENNLSNLDNWKKECKNIDYNYSKYLNGWKLICEKIDTNYIRINSEWLLKCKLIDEQNLEIENNYQAEIINIQKEFEEATRQYNFKRNQYNYLTISEDGKITEEKLVYHYFKYALYSSEQKWLHQLDPEIISIWYLTNILFLLRNKYGPEFFIQMGIPCGIEKKFHSNQKHKAICILIAAYNLVDKYENYNNYIKTSYYELIANTFKVTKYSEEELLSYGINVLPEAYAGLVSLTQKKKLEKGMNLLVDIGGGTTDIAFFTINENNLPDIHCVHSLFKGLNFIYENIASVSKEVGIVNIQNYIVNSNEKLEGYENAINIYKKELDDVTKNIINSIYKSFIKDTSNHKLGPGKLEQAMQNRPIIYSGGGSTFKKLVSTILTFTDTKIINKEMLSIITLKTEINDDNIYSILSTAYGLSIPLENEIELTDISQIFGHIISNNNFDDNSKYEHGLSDY